MVAIARKIPKEEEADYPRIRKSSEPQCPARSLPTRTGSTESRGCDRVLGHEGVHIEYKGHWDNIPHIRAEYYWVRDD